MATVESSGEHHEPPKEPSFLMVVIAAAVAMLLICVLALIVLSALGKKYLPLNHKKSNAQILWPAEGVGLAEAPIVYLL